MRYGLFFTVALIMVLVPAVSAVEGKVQLIGDHFVPLEPEKGDAVEFFVLVLDDNGTGVDTVDLDLGGSKHTMKTYLDPQDDVSPYGMLYHCEVLFEEGGTYNTTYNAHLSNGTTITIKGHPLFINSSTEEKDDTILGLPKTYCAISVLFITFIIIFLTWSYFKGRKMQKEMGASTGSSKIACSACGAPISMDDEKCPKCGAEFEEEEHICGNCGAVISEKDTRCRKCGVKLKGPITDEPKKPKPKEDPDLKKLKRKVDMAGKVKCRKCGAVYLKKEGVCPECGGK